MQMRLMQTRGKLCSALPVREGRVCEGEGGGGGGRGGGQRYDVHLII